MRVDFYGKLLLHNRPRLVSFSNRIKGTLQRIAGQFVYTAYLNLVNLTARGNRNVRH